MIAVVQHHPSRADLLPALTEALAPLETLVSEHESDPPNPWAGYRQALVLGLESGAEHVLVVQDDVIPCANFASAVERLAVEHPVCLFLGAVPASTAARARMAMQKGKRLIPLGPTPFVPLVAVLWPRRAAEDMLAWTKDAKGMTRADDGNVGKWVRRTRRQVYVSVPSLVEHNDFIESVKGGRKATWGKDRGRVALFLADDGAVYFP